MTDKHLRWSWRRGDYRSPLWYARPEGALDAAFRGSAESVHLVDRTAGEVKVTFGQWKDESWRGLL